MSKVCTIHFDSALSWGCVAYDNFAKLQQQLVETEHKNIKIEIHYKGRLGRTFLFLITCLLDLANQYNKNLSVIVSNKIYMYLNDLKFLETSQFNITPGAQMRLVKLDDRNTIAMARDIVEDMPLKLSPKLHEDMVSRIGEMFNNAREHAKAKNVLGCRYTKPNKMFCFACYDTGIGIVNNVQTYLSKELTDRQALEWALARLNSTVHDPGKPRGQGLDLLKEFANVNGGAIRICTGCILYTYDGNSKKETFKDLKNHFMGTLFEMDINAFDGIYSYKGESSYDNNTSQ